MAPPTTSPRIILTGASRGLGLAILKILLEKYNAKVATLSRSYPDALKAVVEQYGKDRVLVQQGDISKPEDNSAIVKSAVEAFGGIDSMILNAGSLDPVGRLGDVSQDALVPFVQANIFSTVYLVQAALPYLRNRDQQTRVVVVSSGASTGGYVAWGLYSMSKAAQNSLVRTLGAEEKENGVSFYAVRPGLVDTDMQKLIREQGQASMLPEQYKKFTDAHEQGGLQPPEVSGSVIAGLAVAGSAELTGQYLDFAADNLAQFRHDA